MQHGTVAILDILGFKGIWRRLDPERVLAKLEAIQRTAAERLNLIHSTPPPQRQWFSFLSDTVVIACSVEDLHANLDMLMFASLFSVCAASTFAQREALNPPALAHRLNE